MMNCNIKQSLLWHIVVMSALVSNIEIVSPEQIVQMVTSSYDIVMDSDCSLLWSDPDILIANDNSHHKTNDEHLLIDISDFHYKMQPEKCNDHVQLLIVIHSAPLNSEKRWFIRDTWGSILHDTPIRLVFLLAAVLDPLQQQVLDIENSSYHDIVQGSFLDAYRNMTYKHVMGLKWFRTNCAQAQLMIKVDDDRIVNTPLLLEYLNRSLIRNKTLDMQPYDIELYVKSEDTAFEFDASKYLFQRPRNLLFCVKFYTNPIIREPENKWFVPESEFAGKHYPTHCSGFTIVYSSDVVIRLYEAAQQLPYFWIDDVHVTGTVRNSTKNTFIVDFGKYAAQSMQRILEGSEEHQRTIPEFLFVEAEGTMQDRYIIWQICQAKGYVKPHFSLI